MINRASILLMLFAGPMLLSGLAACTGTSQVPLSVREREERRHQEADTVSQLEDEAGEVPEVDEEALRHAEEERQEMMREMNQAKYEQTNQALSRYVRAQSALFNGRYNHALRLAESALEVMETADMLALKGAALMMTGEQERAAEHWERAVEMNPDVVADIYPGMRQWYEEHHTSGD